MTYITHMNFTNRSVAFYRYQMKATFTYVIVYVGIRRYILDTYTLWNEIKDKST